MSTSICDNKTRDQKCKGCPRSRGVTLVVEDLNYTVIERRTNEPKKIIDNVTFMAEPGALFAIMGRSGSGKTSVLNALAGRIKASEGMENSLNARRCSWFYRKKNAVRLTANVYCDGPSNFAAVKEISNYVMQGDNLSEFLTVRETLKFAADLRLYHLSKEQRSVRVDSVIKELGLEACADVMVGGSESKKGISGGQKKRVSIAIELLDDPQLLLLDEPTTGLDSSLAYDVAFVLSRLAKEGRTVICTIHQPRSQVFEFFDQLMLLNEGRCVFHGPAKQAIPYFEGLGYRWPASFNPADCLLDLVSPNNFLTSDPSLDAHEASIAKQESVTPSQDHSSVYASSPHGITKLVGSQDVKLESDLGEGPGNLIVSTSQSAHTSANSQEAVFNRFYTSADKINSLPDQFLASAIYQQMKNRIEKIMSIQVETIQTSPVARLLLPKQGCLPRCVGTPDQRLNRRSKKYTGGIGRWFSNFRTLYYRTTLNTIRNPTTSYLTLAVQAAFGLCCGGIFYKLPSGGNTLLETRTNVSNILGYLFLIVCQLEFANFDALLSLPRDRIAFNRDAASGLYSTSAFVCAKMTAEFPTQHIPTTLFCIIAYLMAGLGSGVGQFFEFLLFAQIMVFAACGFVYMIGAGVANFEQANIIAPFLGVLCMIVSGYYLKDSSVPNWIAWFKHINFYRYSFFSLVQVEFPAGRSVGSGPGYLPNQAILDEIAVIPRSLPRWLCAGITFIIGTVFRVCSFLFFKHLNRQVGLET